MYIFFKILFISYLFVRDLERIANFHNTIGDRMITSQRPLMLDAAVSLAQLVKEQTDMTWNNPDKVQRYITKLQQVGFFLFHEIFI